MRSGEGPARIGQIALFLTQGPRAAYPHSYRGHTVDGIPVDVLQPGGGGVQG